MLTRRHGKSIHFHLLILINVVTTILILDVYETLSEISYAVSCYLSTNKLTTFTRTKFDSKYLIFL